MRASRGALILAFCVLTAANAAPSSVGDLARRLQSIPVPIWAEVPAEARPLLTELKHEIRDRALDSISRAYREGEDPRSLGNELQLAFTADMPSSPHCGPLSGRYGCDASVEIEHPDGHPELLAVIVTVGIPCFGDSSLYLAERGITGWRWVLESERTDYTDISEAQRLAFYAVSPRDSAGRFFVVEAGKRPQCGSSWFQIRYAIERPTLDSHRPAVLHRGEFTNHGDCCASWLASDSVTLSFDDYAPVELEEVNLLTQQVARDGVSAPFVLDPQAFLQPWLAAPWTHAARRLAPNASADEIRGWHDALASAIARSEMSVEAVSFDEPRPCRPDGRTQEFSIGYPAALIERSLGGSAQLGYSLPERLYARLHIDAEGAQVERLAAAPDPACGPTE